MRLGETRRRILAFTCERYLAEGRGPTFRAICAASGISSTSTAFSHVESLERDGLVRRDGPRRTVVPTGLGIANDRVPDAGMAPCRSCGGPVSVVTVASVPTVLCHSCGAMFVPEDAASVVARMWDDGDGFRETIGGVS